MLIEMNDKDLVFTESKEYALTSVVSDHGIYERLHGSEGCFFSTDTRQFGNADFQLKLIVNSRANALEIMKILDKDEIEHKKLQET